MSDLVLKLTEATSFPDLNRKEEKDENFEREELVLKRLKYKHFREISKIPEEDQMHHLMLQMTGLSEDDLGELEPDDAAEISNIIFNSMKKYIQLGKNIIGTMNAG